jgi:hypothetical protein
MCIRQLVMPKVCKSFYKTYHGFWCRKKEIRNRMTNIGGESGNGSKNNGTKYRMQYMLEYDGQASKRAGCVAAVIEAFVLAAKILKF